MSKSAPWPPLNGKPTMRSPADEAEAQRAYERGDPWEERQRAKPLAYANPPKRKKGV